MHVFVTLLNWRRIFTGASRLYHLSKFGVLIWLERFGFYLRQGTLIKHMFVLSNNYTNFHKSQILSSFPLIGIRRWRRMLRSNSNPRISKLLSLWNFVLLRVLVLISLLMIEINFRDYSLITQMYIIVCKLCILRASLVLGVIHSVIILFCIHPIQKFHFRPLLVSHLTLELDWRAPASRWNERCVAADMVRSDEVVLFHRSTR